MNVKVSVIIPVFNASKYLEECILSLLDQSLKDCEFIFVNDGSTDDSESIIQHYKSSDSRIKLINQNNKGVSSARNKGLSYATGEYVGFVDSDDYIKRDMYQKLYTTAIENDCDLVISNFNSEINGHWIVTKYPFQLNSILEEEYIKRELLPYLIKSDNLNTVCNKLFRNKILQNSEVIFPPNIALGEDGMFNMVFISNACSVMYIDYTGYCYRQVEGSATRNILEKDYFSRAIEVYQIELPKDIFNHIDKSRLKKLKSIKLINSVLAYINIYFDHQNGILGFSKRYNYVKNMISNKLVREALTLYCEQMNQFLGRYDKFLIEMIKRKSTVGLYLATSYSRFRNK